MFIFTEIIAPIPGNVISNLITPSIEEFLDNTTISNTDKRRKIKNIPSDISHSIDTSYLRFTTANILNVRSEPSVSSSVIKDKIKFGTVVTVLDKRKNWIKISYKKNDKNIKGWVFTRYTKKFE